MSKSSIRRWAVRQYEGNVQPWPLWARLVLGAGLLLLVLKALGVL
ncbi:MAG TPA: hypothetical protein VHO69_03545 [Phototrophicaceae bacterium]|nr:hypothetical protein [Phototrophicaceae bacterium]